MRFDLGARQMILISDPQVAHAIFVTEGEHTSSRASGTYTHDIYAMGGRYNSFFLFLIHVYTKDTSGVLLQLFMARNGRISGH